MTCVLVVEGNTPEAVDAKRSVSPVPPAEHYASALRGFAPSLETVIARPFFDPADVALTLDGFDGVALTGSGVAWSADAPEAAPHRRLVERVFAAGIPVLGSCWGLQVGAVILGGAVGASTLGLEVPVAHKVRLTEAGRRHPLHAGRSPVFDVPCIHRDEVTALPEGAVVTATNAHSAVQAMVYEQGGIRLWGVQYHPEHGADVALGYLMTRGAKALIGGVWPPGLDTSDLEALHADLGTAEGAAAEARAGRHGLGAEVFDARLRGRELIAWLASIGADLSAATGAAVAPTPRLDPGAGAARSVS